LAKCPKSQEIEDGEGSFPVPLPPPVPQSTDFSTPSSAASGRWYLPVFSRTSVLAAEPPVRKSFSECRFSPELCTCNKKYRGQNTSKKAGRQNCEFELRSLARDSQKPLRCLSRRFDLVRFSSKADIFVASANDPSQTSASTNVRSAMKGKAEMAPARFNFRV